MATFDILIIITVVLAGTKGYQRGFIVELFSLVAFILGLIIALKLTFPVAHRFFGDLELFWLIALVIFVLLFLSIVWSTRLLARSIKQAIDFTLVGIIDNVLGVVLSSIKWIFVLSTLIWVATSLDVEMPKNWTDKARLYYVVAAFAPAAVDSIGALIPWFQDILESMGPVPEKI